MRGAATVRRPLLPRSWTPEGIPCARRRPRNGQQALRTRPQDAHQDANEASLRLGVLTMEVFQDRVSAHQPRDPWARVPAHDVAIGPKTGDDEDSLRPIRPAEYRNAPMLVHWPDTSPDLQLPLLDDGVMDCVCIHSARVTDRIENLLHELIVFELVKTIPIDGERISWIERIRDAASSNAEVPILVSPGPDELCVHGIDESHLQEAWGHSSCDRIAFHSVYLVHGILNAAGLQQIARVSRGPYRHDGSIKFRSGD
mmetsp:Transcript_90561/g.235895  ORF Transcript_90561/g.235895 Transcript_90561/m.235895 type:complete len:256 (-) Transcript_90561:839-1606(-)